MKLTKEQTALIQRLYDERITQAEKVALSEVSTTIVFNEVFPLVITKAAAYLDNGYILNPQACNHYQSSPFFEVSMFKPTSQLEQERKGQIDSGSQKSSVETRLDVQDKSMKVSMGGKTWRLGFIGEKSIAKMYATPDGGIAVTYIDNGSDPVFVMRPTNNDGQTAIYTLSLCSEA